MFWRFLFNPDLCLGCRSCETACRNEFGLQGGERWRRVVEVEPGEDSPGHFLSLSCNHCENPECIRVCKEGTYRKRKDGIVIHDPRHCGGCGDCIKACPFASPKYSSYTGRVDKCNLCYHRLDHGQPAACVEACPVGALTHLFPNEKDPVGTSKIVEGFGDISVSQPAMRFIHSQEKPKGD